MVSTGIELLLELHECQQKRINDIRFIRGTALKCIQLLEIELEKEVIPEKQPPNQLVYLAVISESHIIIRSYPARGEVEVDIYTCGNKHPAYVIPFLQKKYQAKIASSHIVKRGVGVKTNSS